MRPYSSSLSVLLLLLLLSCPLSHSQPATLRGIRKRDQPQYTAANFTCFDSSASYPSTRVNDDYCDCADGSDEPGTSACPNSTFFCPNRGASSFTLHSSRVNDHICDCCDGSDEWASQAKCSNKCAEEGREKHKHVLEEIAATEAGVKIRQGLAQQASIQKAEQEARKAVFEAKVADRQKLLDEAKGRTPARTNHSISARLSPACTTSLNALTDHLARSVFVACVTMQPRSRSRRRLSR